MKCEHRWTKTGKVEHHAYSRQPVIYVKCDHCGQVGFRNPGKNVIYTWQDQSQNG